MRFDDLDFSKLPVNGEEAFTKFVNAVNDEFSKNIRNDRDEYSDINGNYQGAYEPERSFVTAILAFLDEYEIESEIIDISELSNQDFYEHFLKFKSKVDYLTTRFKLRQHRIKFGGVGTLITIDSDFKSEIGKLLDAARKIVNREVTDINKKGKIFAKIAILQSEVDRDITTVDALFGRMLDLTKTIGKSAENLEPLVDKLERVKKLFWDNSKKVEQLPKPERPKLIAKEQTSVPQGNSDDEIPF